MRDKDAILNATVPYSEEEVLAEFQECCEAEAEAPGEDPCQMLERHNRAQTRAQQGRL